MCSSSPHGDGFNWMQPAIINENPCYPGTSEMQRVPFLYNCILLNCNVENVREYRAGMEYFVTNGHGYVPLVVKTFRSFLRS
jgi:hypothetical protein